MGLVTLLAGILVITVNAELIKGDVTIRPGAPDAEWSCTLQPKDSATFTVTVVQSEMVNGILYVLKQVPASQIIPPGQDVIWSGGPTVFNIVNESSRAMRTTAKTTCVWGPSGGGGGGHGQPPPEIRGSAIGTADLKIAHVAWCLTPLIQEASINNAINWTVSLVNDQGNTVQGLNVNFLLSAVNVNQGATWVVEPVIGSGPMLPGTVKSAEPSKGRLQVEYVYFGKKMSDTSGELGFVNIDKLQYQAGSKKSWKDMPTSLEITRGTTVEFKVLKKPENINWPTGRPIWTGISGSGDDATKCFDEVGSYSFSVKCGNIVYGTVLVVDQK